MKPPVDYVKPEERVPRERDCILCAMLFGAAGTVFGWACAYLYLTFGQG
jgi:hypothetical protein